MGLLPENNPTREQLAASIGCEPTQITRSVRNALKSRFLPEGQEIWTSFVDDGNPERLAVFETLWPQ